MTINAVKPVLQGADLGKWSKIRKLYTLQEAWTNGKVRRNEMKYVGLRRKKYKFVYPSLACTRAVISDLTLCQLVMLNT